MDWKQIVAFVLPLVIETKAPKLKPLIPVIAQGIQDAEALIDASGPEKAAHVKALAQTAATGINAVAGRMVVDPSLVGTVGASAISLTVDIANRIHRDSQ